MEQRETTQFSWIWLFVITAVSFFMFSGFVKVLNGSSAHAALFFKIGIVALVLGAIAFINSFFMKAALKK
jgi:hypothetical protein